MAPGGWAVLCISALVYTGRSRTLRPRRAARDFLRLYAYQATNVAALWLEGVRWGLTCAGGWASASGVCVWHMGRARRAAALAKCVWAAVCRATVTMRTRCTRAGAPGLQLRSWLPVCAVPARACAGHMQRKGPKPCWAGKLPAAAGLRPVLRMQPTMLRFCHKIRAPRADTEDLPGGHHARRAACACARVAEFRGFRGRQGRPAWTRPGLRSPPRTSA